MRKITITLITVLLTVVAFVAIPSVHAETFQDPFSCSPYKFVFDFPLKCKVDCPYDSIMYPILVYSALDEAQTITLSMWPEYVAETNPADSSWFTIEPLTAHLPARATCGFAITAHPPYKDLPDGIYRTYVKVATKYESGYYWDRPLSVSVRIGSSVPVVDYNLGEGFKIAEITGDEQSAYTQDEVTIRVNNKSSAPNEFVLYPVEASPPTSPVEPDAAGDFLDFQLMWRDPIAQTVYVEPRPSTYNADTNRSNEYRLFTKNPETNAEVEFGTFLAATYSRTTDEPPVLAYPYRIDARKSADIPFTLRVNKTVPSGIYRLQIHIAPCGISTVSQDGTGIGVEYECKIPVKVTRVKAADVSSGLVFPVILIGASTGLVAFMGSLYGYQRLKPILKRRRYAAQLARNGKGRATVIK